LGTTFQQQLRVPGPTPLPERVVRAMSRPLVDHRGPEFAELLAGVTEGVRRVFQTEADLLIFTLSGTGGLESVMANLVSPGDRVLAAICGNFGERFADMAAAYGADVLRLEAEWGQPVDPADLRDLLAAHPEVGLVLLTHNETSTGVTNPLPELAAIARSHGALVAVDGVSSISSIPIQTDAWGIDVAVSSSQKGWMSPPGLALLSVGPRAWQRRESARSPRFYLDWGPARDFAAKGATPFTPAVSLFYALQEGLRMIEEEGLEAVYQRHRRIAGAVAAGLEAAGFQLLAAAGFRSATVTAALLPDGLAEADLRRLLRERYGVVVAGGQGRMAGKMIRVGHLGSVSEGDVVQVLWAVEQALERLDVAPSDGRTLAAATAQLSEEPAPARI
jgi:aspartate aminotransferase-like enzyme